MNDEQLEKLISAIKGLGLSITFAAAGINILLMAVCLNIAHHHP